MSQHWTLGSSVRTQIAAFVDHIVRDAGITFNIWDQRPREVRELQRTQGMPEQIRNEKTRLGSRSYSLPSGRRSRRRDPIQRSCRHFSHR